MSLHSTLRRAALAATGVLCLSAAASAAQVSLKAMPASVPLGSDPGVPMWVFRCVSTDTAASCEDGPVSPVIRTTANQALQITLENTLSRPVSLLIPGQIATSWNPDLGSGRVRSFDTAAGPNTTGTSYEWVGLKPGAYLLRSGSEPSVQVQMGLYAAVIVEDPDTTDDDQDVVLLFSEVDPVMHQRVEAVAAGGGCAVDNGGGTQVRCSTLDYTPRYFLINGVPYDAAPAPIEVSEGLVRLRLLNAGQSERVAMLGDGLEMTLVLQDGFDSPVVRTQASAFLAPGKAIDADVVIPPVTIEGQTVDRSYPVYDRRLGLTTDNQPYGGALTHLHVAGDVQAPTGGGGPAFTATDDTWLSPQGGSVTADLLANDNPPLGVDDVTIAIAARSGTLTPGGSIGTFTYVPNGSFVGTDIFAYYYSVGGSGSSNVAFVTVTVADVNEKPVAAADSYEHSFAGALDVDARHGLLANDSDADGDTLQACLSALPAGLTAKNGTTAGPGGLVCFDGTFTYGGAGVSFSYQAWDGTLLSDDTVAVDVAVNTVMPPVLVVGSPDQADPTSYRWVLEEDPTYHPEDWPELTGDPGTWTREQMDEVLALSFHKSYAPVVASGCNGEGCVALRSACADLEPADETATGSVQAACEALLQEFSTVRLAASLDGKPRHYFVSVLPLDGADGENGHTLGGSGFVAGTPQVEVRVNDQPEPSAQISIIAFEDNRPTNGVYDPGEGELPLGGFQIILEDGGGRYGAAAGIVLEDKDGMYLRNALCPEAGEGVTKPGVVVTCPAGHARAGEALIRNLAPAKYGVFVVPPAGNTNQWVQTSTIEGKKVIDAWVKQGESARFREFGPPGYHVAIGFVHPNQQMPAEVAGGNTITGKVTNLRMSRPPDQTLYDSGSHDTLAASPAWVGVNLNGTENYLAIETDPDTGAFTLDGLPDGTHELVVWDKFLDTIIAFRQLTLPCGGENPSSCDIGNVPVFSWFGRTENTVFEDLNGNGSQDAGENGMLEQGTNLRWRDGTIYASIPTDIYGEAPYDETFPFFHWLVAEVDFARYKATGVEVTVDSGGPANPSDPVVGADSQSRVETGPALLEGFQVFIGQTNRLAWGKKAYAQGENGGITGIVFYDTTRAEDDPGLAGAEVWEPGIAGVKVRLYKKLANGKLALVKETTTDSWDENPPEGCSNPAPAGGSSLDAALEAQQRCFDGLRNFNQVRPALFDGGYAFGLGEDLPDEFSHVVDGVEYLDEGTYVVEVVPPPGYQILKEEDKNVDFGATYDSVYVFSPDGTHLVLPDQADVGSEDRSAGGNGGVGAPDCVGDPHIVPDYLALFPDQMIDAPYQGYKRPLCDRQEVVLAERANAATDFFLLTETPVAAHFVGMILDDTAVEFDKNSPNFGEKWAPPDLPVSVRDWTGFEIGRLYADRWGRYNGLGPSTYSVQVPMSSGVNPNMLVTCMNDPLLPDGGIDPNWDPRYANFCYTFQFMPGATTYLDTPVLPVSAFAAGDNPVDCAFPSGTPRIASVTGSVAGPWVRQGDRLTITSVGQVQVPNPAYDGPTGTEPRTIQRDYRFGGGGNQSQVLLNSVPVTVSGGNWKPDSILTDPIALAPGRYQLTIVRSDGTRSITSVTVTVAPASEQQLPGVVLPGASIQAAVDLAAPGGLVLVGAGTFQEPVILWKPVQLQGVGEASIISARPYQSVDSWYASLESYFTRADGWVAAPGQEVTFGDFEPTALGTETVPAVTVLGRPGDFTEGSARVDGFTLTGAEVGGGVFVNGYADYLQISNNRIANNQGYYHGGVRIGHYELQQADPLNRFVGVHHNAITQNGALAGAGGAVSICSGSDGFLVSDNWICGNFTGGDGAGVGIHGRSDAGRILRNRIVFNQSFYQGLTRHGGGIVVDGIGAATGSGDQTIDANLIQGNHAAVGDGAGIRVQFATAADDVDITNNMIVNNVAGGAAGGVSVLASAPGKVRIVNNTIARNDSTATAATQFTSGNVNLSEPAPAGVVSDALSSPALFNNVIWENRSFRYMVIDGVSGLCPGSTADNATACASGNFFDDLGGPLVPGNNLMSGSADPFQSSYFTTTRSAWTVTTTPLPPNVAPALDEGGNFIEVRFGPLSLLKSTSQPWGDYHLASRNGNAALASGQSAGAPAFDYDGQGRPIPAGTLIDRGADEAPAPPGGGNNSGNGNQ